MLLLSFKLNGSFSIPNAQTQKGLATPELGPPESFPSARRSNSFAIRELMGAGTVILFVSLP